MKFGKWYEKNRPVLFAISSLWFMPAKFRKPIQQLLEVLDHAVSVGGVFIENLNVKD